MNVLVRAGARIRHLLLAVGLIAACAAVTGAVAVPAFATNEYYECGFCAEVNGKENWVKNNQTINHSGGGICAALWRNNGGGNYTLMADECRSGEQTATVCTGGEFWGHGEAESEYGNGYLRGRQDNFTYCG